MRLALLDRAATTPGESAAETLRGVITHARTAQELGFSRFFVAEHHGVPGIPGSQPTMLATAVAAHTTTMRVGTAGIMVPNHPPFLVAEQISVLEALFPGRIDVGLGSSVGFTRPVRQALRQGEPRELKSRFPQDVDELLGYLRGQRGSDEDKPLVQVRPEVDSRTPLFILAGFRSATLAAQRGIGVIVGGPVETQKAALKAYRTAFQPSPWLDAPYAISSLNIAVGDTASQAQDLLLPENYSKIMAQSTGAFEKLIPARQLRETGALDKLTAQQRSRLEQAQAHDITGTLSEVESRLAQIAEDLDVEEILVTGDMPDREGRLHNEKLLASLI